MLLSFFQLSLAIRNVWPQRMSLKRFIELYLLLLLAGMPVTLLSCIPYGLFGILAAVCVYGLVTYRDTAAQNVCMGMIGCVLTIVIDNFLTILLHMLIPLSFINPHFVVLFNYVVLRQIVEKSITVKKGCFTPSADVVCDGCRIAAPYNDLFV